MQPHGAPVQPPAPPKKEGSFLLALFIVGLMGACAVGLVTTLNARSTTTLNPLTAIRQPVTLVSQTVVLREGNAMGYGFSLNTQANVEVNISATPKPVNVMLMREEQWQRYRQVHGSLFGGRFEYVNRLSATNVTRFAESSDLPAGQWRIVVERPSEAILFGDDTSATVNVIGR